MYRFRPFRNSDPPAISEIWRRQAPQRGLMQPMTTALVEQLVLAKPYFDRAGLILATRNDQPVGFVHAGFGPSEAGGAVNTELGVTCMLMVRPEEAGSSLAADLLARSEQYLRDRGAKLLYAGAIRPLDPFYLGLYGGSELPGVLLSDEARQALYREQGYEEIDRVVVLHCDLRQFRAPIDRRQVQIRRSMELQVDHAPTSRTWWEACTLGPLERTRYEVTERNRPQRQAELATWDLEPLASGWGVRACGLLDLEVEPSRRRQGLASYLLSESFRLLQSQGVSLVEAQTMVHNAAARALYDKLGFKEVDQGTVLRKRDER